MDLAIVIMVPEPANLKIVRYTPVVLDTGIHTINAAIITELTGGVNKNHSPILIENEIRTDTTQRIQSLASARILLLRLSRDKSESIIDLNFCKTPTTILVTALATNHAILKAQYHHTI